MGKNTDENMGKNLSGKYIQKLLDHAKQSATNTFKTKKCLKDLTKECFRDSCT